MLKKDDKTETSRIELPDKLFFKIGEVKEIAGVQQHVLRYWESEFSNIRPQKSKTNQRQYRRKDVEAVLAIKHLLYDKKFTIEGAKKFLKEQNISSALPPPDPESVADAARKEVTAQMTGELKKVKKSVIDHYEKELLSLQQEIKTHISGLKEKLETHN